MLVPLALAASLLGAASAAKTDCARDELNGPVHTVDVTFQSLKKESDGSIDTQRLPSSNSVYDRSCTLIESKRYSTDFIDDQHPQRLDATTVLIRSNMGDKRVRERYDAAGNLVETWTFAAGTAEVLEHEAFTYDAVGYTIRIDDIDTSGKPYDVTILTRDAGEHVVREEFKFGDGRTQIETYAYKFDSHGNWIEETESGNDPDAGTTAIVPIGILYRTISYYSPAVSS